MAEATSSHQCTEMSGWLFKWTSYLRGYQKRWFVLSNGYLSYYRDQNEMDLSYCGSIYMQGAMVFSEEPNTIVVSNGDTYRVKTVNETEKQRWVEALESATGFVSESQAANTGNASVAALTDMLREKLEDLQKRQVLFTSHGHALQSSLSAIEVFSSFETMAPKIREINERAAIFRASTSSLISACSDYLDLAEVHSDKWLKRQQNERHQRIWSDNVLALMRRLSPNKQGKSSSVIKNSLDSSCTTNAELEPSCSCEAYTNVLVYPAFGRGSKQSKSSKNEGGTNPTEEGSNEHADTPVNVRGERGTKKRKEVRKSHSHSETTCAYSEPGTSTSPKVPLRRIQIPDRPPSTMSLWSLIKNHAGKDLSKMPVPINFSEPLSLLQRLTEDFEHAYILDRAYELHDPVEQIAHVACFAVACYSSTPLRTTKPFNPLLGETFECDRYCDLGWKSIAEQVSHHPPISALHCEGKHWTCWLDQSMTTKFQGQNLSFSPSGDVHLKFNSGNYYVWNKVTSNIHNVIIGKLWVDQEGDMNIKCFTNRVTCKVSFLSPGYFSGEPHKVKGFVFDAGGHTKANITGGYDSKLEISVMHDTGNKHRRHSWQNDVVWLKTPLKEGADKYYNFTVFACQLNEMEDGIAPTDSRNRPDQRFMENGQWEEAATKKAELEEVQRGARMSKEDTPDTDKTQEPVWFRKEKDPHTNKDVYVYKGKYWSCKKNKDWSQCPVIFS